MESPPSTRPFRRGSFYHLLLPSCILLVLILLGSCTKEPSAPTEPQVDEPEVNVDPQIVAWLRSNCLPFRTSKAESGFEDLASLKEMVGSARVVALGEATHGTKEFFEMKHRILEFLVKEMGFNIFAIEATWPESNLVNDYVQTGIGDPARLLAGLYFWTWNTQEVLDMILWMRRHNQNPGSAPKVSFYGFDMQYPKMAMDNVIAYLQKIDPPSARRADSLYSFYRPYQTNQSGYGGASSDVKITCRTNLRLVYDHLVAHRALYEGKSSAREFALALQSARVAIQAEEVFSKEDPGTRDQFMAENAQWLLDQAAADSMIVLWAHNGHVSASITGGSMGSFLRSVYGGTMVVLGFDFYGGSFNAVSWNLATGTATGPLTSHHVEKPPSDSYEYLFRGAGIPRFMLDLRRIPTGDPASSWIHGPRKFRSIGAIYDAKSPQSFYYSVQLPRVFDVLVYFQDTSPSVLLPFYSGSMAPMEQPHPPAPRVF